MQDREISFCSSEKSPKALGMIALFSCFIYWGIEILENDWIVNYVDIKQQEIYFEMVSGNCLVDCSWAVKRNPLSSYIFVVYELRSKRHPPNFQGQL